MARKCLVYYVVLLFSHSCVRGSGSTDPVYMCFVDLEKAPDGSWTFDMASTARVRGIWVAVVQSNLCISAVRDVSVFLVLS